MTPITRPQIVAAARQWLGTPYLHQGRVKGAGVDCAGLVVGIAHQLGLSTFDTLAYGRLPSGNALRGLLAAHAIPTTGPWLPGQIALLRFDTEPAHLGVLAIYPGASVVVPASSPILSPFMSLIHAYSHTGCVTEHRLADVWRARVVERIEFPFELSSLTLIEV